MGHIFTQAPGTQTHAEKVLHRTRAMYLKSEFKRSEFSPQSIEVSTSGILRRADRSTRKDEQRGATLAARQVQHHCPLPHTNVHVASSTPSPAQPERGALRRAVNSAEEDKRRGSLTPRYYTRQVQSTIQVQGPCPRSKSKSKPPVKSHESHEHKHSPEQIQSPSPTRESSEEAAP